MATARHYKEQWQRAAGSKLEKHGSKNTPPGPLLPRAIQPSFEQVTTIFLPIYEHTLINVLRHVDLPRVFFVDIETVPGHATHAELPATHQPLWRRFCEKRYARELADGQTHEELFAHGGLYAESSKVVCISVGLFHFLANGTLGFRIKSFAHDDECEVLRGFANLLGTRRP